LNYHPNIDYCVTTPSVVTTLSADLQFASYDVGRALGVLLQLIQILTTVSPLLVW